MLYCLIKHCTGLARYHFDLFHDVSFNVHDVTSGNVVFSHEKLKNYMQTPLLQSKFLWGFVSCNSRKLEISERYTCIFDVSYFVRIEIESCQQVICGICATNHCKQESVSFLTLKVPITTAADDIHEYFFIVVLEKIRLDISCESSARQRIHIKHQALFCSKDKSKKISVVCCKFLFGTLRVKMF